MFSIGNLGFFRVRSSVGGGSPPKNSPQNIPQECYTFLFPQEIPPTKYTRPPPPPKKKQKPSGRPEVMYDSFTSYRLYNTMLFITPLHFSRSVTMGDNHSGMLECLGPFYCCAIFNISSNLLEIVT